MKNALKVKANWKEEQSIRLEKKLSEFTFDNMARFFRQTISTFPDPRTGKNTQYTMEDVVIAAFSVFLTHCSFLVLDLCLDYLVSMNNFCCKRANL